MAPVWRDLGTIAPYFNWQLYPEVDMQGDIFRITQNNAINLPKGSALFGFIYPFTDGDATQIVEIVQPQWEDTNSLLIRAPVFPEFVAAGITVRSPAVRLTFRSTWVTPSWELKLEVFQNL